jgi:ferredoxin
VRYEARRKDTLLVAAHCNTAAATCFCHSMGTGPRADGFDLALSEGVREGRHLFIMEVGSTAGAQTLSGLALTPAREEDLSWARGLTENATQQMKRAIEPEVARDVLKTSLESKRWQQVAERCLACTNCTASCPTCFCTSIEDVGELDGSSAHRIRTTDSCFNTNFSYVHGGPVRASLASRYRQWLTHKFSTWYEQFGSSGCVGCGRCITWCPVGIDVTEELTNFVADARGKKQS